MDNFIVSFSGSIVNYIRWRKDYRNALLIV